MNRIRLTNYEHEACSRLSGWLILLTLRELPEFGNESESFAAAAAAALNRLEFEATVDPPLLGCASSKSVRF